MSPGTRRISTKISSDAPTSVGMKSSSRRAAYARNYAVAPPSTV
jgi:hypothetical protein